MKALSITGNTYTVTGRVLGPNGEVPPGVIVKAMDYDRLGKDDFLGSARVNQEGLFSISFDRSAFGNRFFDRKPDLYFIVQQTEDLLSTANAVMKNADESLPAIELVLPTAPNNGGTPQTPQPTVAVPAQLHDYGYTPFNDLFEPSYTGIRLSQLAVHHNDVVDGLRMIGDSASGQHVGTPQEGGQGGEISTIDVAADMRVAKITYDTGVYYGANHIYNLMVYQQPINATGDEGLKVFGPFGNGMHQTRYAGHTLLEVPPGQVIVGMQGSSYVHADGSHFVSSLGIYHNVAP